MPPTPPLGHRVARLYGALRCVTCHSPLRNADDALCCTACDARYPVVHGCPVLMTDAMRKMFAAHLESDDGRRMVGEYGAAASASTSVTKPSWTRWLKPPPVMYRYHPDLLKPPTSVLFDPVNGAPPLTLSVGGGPYRVGDHEITLNIGLFPNVDMVADAHDIPIADNTFDAVFSLAVLEHVADPYRVVSEMIRVLKPGGVLYSEIPFIFFFHGYPTDYTRFTREGMKRLFAGLESPEVGMTHGPVSAVLQSANMLMDMCLPARPRIVRKAFNGLFRCFAFPLKYLDLLLRTHPDAHILAGGFYVLGRKPPDA